MQRVLIRLRKPPGVIFRRQRTSNVDRTRVADPGALNARDIGASFTDPKIYRGAATASRLESNEAEHRLLQASETLRSVADHQQHLSNEMRFSRTPTNAEEKKISRMHDVKELELSGEPSATPFDKRTASFLTMPADRRENRISRHPQEPKKVEVRKLVSSLGREDSREQTAMMMRERLAKEHGIFASQRLDAYMLGDDSMFPTWVNELPFQLRDAVRFGGIGLTEDDQVLRVRLSRLPLDRRTAEWDRLRRARAYRDGIERRLSLSEIRHARLAKRQHYALFHRRQKRNNMLKVLALDKPEKFEVWPIDRVDYSKRMATIAQHVEAKLSTHGQWPLDGQALVKAKLRRKQEEAELTFLNPKGHNEVRRKINPHIASALEDIDEQPKPIKRISRKNYRRRWSAIVAGFQNEYGHSFRKMRQMQKHPEILADTPQQSALRREVGSQMVSGENTRLTWRDTKMWPEPYRREVPFTPKPTFK